MRKKILCVAMSVIMAVGTLVGCGSSSGGTSKKVESTILTEITPGKSTGEDFIKYFDTNGFTYDTYDSNDTEPRYMTNTGIFLGHEYYVDYINCIDKSGVVCAYGLKIAFKDAEDYQNGVAEVDSYFKSMSLGVAATGKDSEYTYHYFLIEDNDDYTTCLRYYPKTYEDAGDGYYNTVIKVDYIFAESNLGDIKWKDAKGNNYTLKCSANNTSSTEN